MSPAREARLSANMGREVSSCQSDCAGALIMKPARRMAQIPSSKFQVPNEFGEWCVQRSRVPCPELEFGIWNLEFSFGIILQRDKQHLFIDDLAADIAAR